MSLSVTVAAEQPASAVKSAQRVSATFATADVNPTTLQQTAKQAAASKRVRSSRASRALAFARRQMGDRYRWGASGPNAWDCSGLTQGAWRAAGVRLPHNARAQFNRGRKVSRSNLRPGDLVFFYRGIRHVGIYAGNGKVIHAPGTGKRVRVAKVSSMPYQGARRVG